MIGIINDVHPIILDTIVVSVFVLMIFFGVIKGIKNTAIDFGILLVSLFLGFCPFTDDLKIVVAKNFLKLSDWMPAGSDNSYKLAASLFTNLLAALAIFLLFYLLLHVIRMLITIIVRKKRKDQERAPKSKVGRAFAGILALLYQGAIFVVLMIVMNNNLIGMNSAFEKSTVTKFVVNNSTNLVNKIDEDMESKLVVKMLKGDAMFAVDEDVVESYCYLEENAEKIFMDKTYMEVLSDEKLTNEEAVAYIKERLIAVSHIANFVNALDEFEMSENEYANVAEEWITAMHRAMTNRSLGQVEFSMNKFSQIRLRLVDSGLSDKVIGLYDEIAIGK